MRLRLLLLILLLTMFAATSVAAPSTRTVRVGAFNYYPALFKADDGAINGFYVDLLTEIARRENWNIIYVYGSWDEGLKRLKSGDVDLLTSVARTPERETWMDFGQTPLLTVWGELYVRPGSKILGIRDAAGKTVAVMRGDFNASSFMHLTEMLRIDCTYVVVSDFDAVFSAIERGEVDGGVVNSTYGSARLKTANVVSSGVIFNPFDIYFATRKGDHADLLLTLDGYLDAWQDEKDSPYYLALRRWGHGDQAAPAEIPPWLTTTLWILLAALAVGTAFIIMLRREVRRATHVLQQSERRYHSLFENSPVSLWEEDFHQVKECLDALRRQGVADLAAYLHDHPEVVAKCAGEIIINDVNQATLLLHQARTKEELLDNLTRTFNENSLRVFVDELLALWDGETSFSMEGPVQTLQGEQRRVLLHLQVVPGHEQKLDRVLISLLDITDRTKALRAEAAARLQLRNLLHAVSDGIVVIDAGGEIVLLNPAAEALLGIDQNALGQALLQSGADSELLNWLQLGPLPRSTPGLLTLTDRHSGQRRQIQVQGFTGEGGDTPAGTILTLRDVTREMESDRMKSAFIATAAHELRTPLASILGFAELLQNIDQPTPEALHEYVGIIHDRGATLQHIIDDLLDISRVESGHLVHLEKAPCDLVDLLRQLEKTITMQFGDYQFDFDLPETAPPTDADPYKLNQVLENLLSNAVKFSPPQSRIGIRAVHDAAGWTITVADNGIGLTPEQAERVFDRFYRADTSDTAKQGLGLGMTIARAIVEAHGGTIRIESTPGAGTTVIVTLPDAGRALSTA